jgi:DNA repair protein RecN (Recombination protein N)
MITQLSIRGLAIIEELHIEFSPQLNVITGETGAGKSILIKALHFLLGAKADPDVIRRGFPRAHVSASFLLPKSHGCVEVLDAHGIWHDDQDLTELIIRREIAQKGRSQAWVNDQPITLSLLKELGATLIDIYGQHENHRMLDPHTHMDYIDEFVADRGLKTKVTAAMQQAQQVLQELRKRLEQYQTRRREQDYLQFRFDEMARFGPSVEDYERTVKVCEESSIVLSQQKVFDQAQRICDEGYNGRALTSAMQELQRLLEVPAEKLQDASLMASLAQLNELSAVLDELSYGIGRAISRHSLDEEEIEELQSRLAGYQSLMRKHSVRSVEEMMSEYERLESELSFVQQGPEAMAEALDKLKKLLNEADEFAHKLSAARKEAAQRAVQAVVSELHDLNMKGARIDFDFQEVQNTIPDLDIVDIDPALVDDWQHCANILTETGKNGRERGQFLLSANPGEGLKPLAKVASGGEISRIMLGFKKALAMGANTCVMVFDEIDTGISGHTAHIVGKKLKELSTSFQVICISHLPQVAAYGDAHFLVQKAQKGESTESQILKLNRKASEEEIARLLSGDQVTSSSLTHARQLIKAARDRVAQ